MACPDKRKHGLNILVRVVQVRPSPLFVDLRNLQSVESPFCQKRFIEDIKTLFREGCPWVGFPSNPLNAKLFVGI